MSAVPPMRFGEIARVGKPVSRLVVGVLDQESDDSAAALLDAFFAAGGNAIDTAWMYGQGRCERLVGRWLERRGVRDEAVIVVKGAHTPHCTPYDLSRQLVQSLDRLRTDHADIYLVHRDNDQVPVGEFMDILNQHHAAGRVRSFGASNWSMERVAAANAYAAANRLHGIVALSNQLSLARMVQPTFPGCVDIGDERSRDELAERQLAVVAWSSQARGFFARADRNPLERLRIARFARVLARRAAALAGRPGPGGWDHDELVRCWYSRDNFRRLARATQLAGERRVEVTAVALAYVLHQPFPTFAVIGPRDASELRSSVAALDVELSPGECAWLDLSADRR